MFGRSGYSPAREGTLSEAPIVTEETRAFRFVRFIARLCLLSQYRRIEVEGAEKVPAEGAVLLVANHFSSIVDSMALLYASPRPAGFLAKQPLWDSALLAPCLDAVGAVPVFRPQDAKSTGRGARANLATFESCWERLRAGGSMAIFPEGVSQSRPRLMPIRSGAARIALGANVPVAICPVGLIFDRADQGQRGTMLVRFGEPFVVDGVGAYPSRRAAITSVTRQTEESLRELLAEAETYAELSALQTLRVVWEQERGEPDPTTLVEQHRRDRRFARGLARLKEQAPDKLGPLRDETEAYMRLLDVAGITPELLHGRYRLGQLWGYLLRVVPLLLIGFPIAVLAAVVTWPVRRIGDIVAMRTMGSGEDVRAFARMMGGGLLLAILMIAGGIAAGLLWGWWAALLVVVGLPALLAYHIFWTDRSHDIRARARCLALLSGGQLRRDLRSQRRALYEHLLEVREHLVETPAATAEVSA